MNISTTSWADRSVVLDFTVPGCYPLIVASVLIGVLLFLHSIYYSGTKYSYIRILSELASLSCAGQSIAFLTCLTGSCSAQKHALFQNVLGATIFGGLVNQVCDNFVTFQRYQVVINHTASRAHKWLAFLWVVLFMILPWLPFFTVLPIWIDLNSTEWIRIQYVICVIVYFIGYIIFELFYLFLVTKELYTLHRNQHIQIATPTAEPSVQALDSAFVKENAIRAILHTIVSVAGAGTYSFGGTPGLLIQCLMYTITLHFLLNVKVRMPTCSRRRSFARKTYSVLMGLVQKQHLVAVLVLITFFAPLFGWIPLANTTQKEDFIRHKSSIIIAFSCALTLTAPYSVDMLLDVFNRVESPFLYERLISTASLTICSIAVLSSTDSSAFVSITISTFAWTLSIEFVLLLNLQHQLNSFVLSLIQKQIIVCLFYGFLMSALISSYDKSGAAYVCTIIFLLLLTILLLSCTANFASRIFFRFRRGRTIPLNIDKKYSSVLLAVIVLSVMAVYFLFFAFGLADLSTPLFNADNIVPFVALRCILFYVSQSLPCRLYRMKLSHRDKDSNATTKLIKYFSHEVRSPIMSMSISIEVLKAQLENLDRDAVLNISGGPAMQSLLENLTDLRKCRDVSVRVLDSMLLYEKIKWDNLKLALTPLALVECIQNGFSSFLSSAAALGIETDVQISESMQVEGSELRIDVDVNHLQLVLNTITNASLRSSSTTGTVSISLSVSTAYEVDRMFDSPRRFVVDELEEYSTFASRYGKSDLDETNPRLVVSDDLLHRNASVLLVQLTDRRGRLSGFELTAMLMHNFAFTRAGHGDGVDAGLELWMARRLMRLHEGDLCVEMISDDPSEFKYTFFLPISTADSAIGLDQPVPAMRRESFPRGLRGSSLVIAVDESNNPVAVTEAGPPVEIPTIVNEQASISNLLATTRYVSCLLICCFSRMIGICECRLKVLIVDDSEMVRKMMTRLVRLMNFDCIEADDGDTAVEIIRVNSEHGIELVLMDNEMPRMRGAAAVEIMRKNLGFRGCVLGITGNVSEKDLQDYLARGCDEVLMKPVTADDIRSSLCRVFSASCLMTRSSDDSDFHYIRVPDQVLSA